MIKIFTVTSKPMVNWWGSLENEVNAFCDRDDVEVTAITLTQSDAPASPERMTVLVRYIQVAHEVEPQPGGTHSRQNDRMSLP